MTQKNLLQSAGDGTAVPSGYVGEYIESKGTGATVNLTWTNLTSIALTPGIWIIFGDLTNDTGASGAAITELRISILTSPTPGVGVYGDTMVAVAGNSSRAAAGASLMLRANITSNTTYYLHSIAVGAALSATAAYKLFAVRIA